MSRHAHLMSMVALAAAALADPPMPRASRRHEDAEDEGVAPDSKRLSPGLGEPAAVPFIMPPRETLAPLSGAVLPPPPGRPANPRKKAQRRAQRAARRAQRGRR